jgi:hypothetical protein
MKPLFYGLGAAACVTALATAVEASTIGLDFQGKGRGQTMPINYLPAADPANVPEGHYFQGGTTQETVHTGQLLYEVTSVTGAAANYFSVGNQLILFCVDIFDQASSGLADFVDLGDAPIPAGPDGPMGAMRADLLSVLFQQRRSEAQGDSNVQAAAFALAVWEIGFEPTAQLDANTFAQANLDTGDGEFFASGRSATRALANEWIEEAWLAWRDGANGLPMAAAAAHNFQDVALIIPLPTPVWMAGMGLLAVPLLRRRFSVGA